MKQPKDEMCEPMAGTAWGMCWAAPQVLTAAEAGQQTKPSVLTCHKGQAYICSAVGAFSGQQKDKQMQPDGSCILVPPISGLTAPAATYRWVPLICKQHW